MATTFNVTAARRKAEKHLRLGLRALGVVPNREWVGIALDTCRTVRAWYGREQYPGIDAMVLAYLGLLTRTVLAGAPSAACAKSALRDATKALGKVTVAGTAGTLGGGGPAPALPAREVVPLIGGC